MNRKIRNRPPSASPPATEASPLVRLALAHLELAPLGMLLALLGAELELEGRPR